MDSLLWWFLFCLRGYFLYSLHIRVFHQAMVYSLAVFSVRVRARVGMCTCTYVWKSALFFIPGGTSRLIIFCTVFCLSVCHWYIVKKSGYVHLPTDDPLCWTHTHTSERIEERQRHTHTRTHIFLSVRFCFSQGSSLYLCVPVHWIYT